MNISWNCRTPPFGSHKLIAVTALLVFALFTGRAHGQETLPTTTALEALVSKWVDLRREISVEQQSWKEQKAHLERERELLLREKGLLEHEIAEKENLQALQEKQRTELAQKKGAYQKAGVSPGMARVAL